MALPAPRLLLLLAALGMHVVWLLAGAPQALWRSALGNLAFLPIFLFSALLLFQAARGAGRAAETWRWMGYGMLSWSVGQVLYFLFDSVLQLHLFPSVADVFFLLTFPCIAFGLSRLRRPQRSPLQTLSLLVDALLVVLIVGDVTWSTSVQFILASYQGQPLALGVSLAYPLVDLLLCSMLVTLALWSPPDLARREVALLAGGMAAFLSADLIYAYQRGLDNYRPGTLLDAGWTLAAVLIGAAAYSHHHRQARGWVSRTAGSAAIDRWSPLLPHYAVLAAFAVYMSFHLRSVTLDQVQVTILILVTALFIVRQVLVLTDNQRLHLRLAHRAEHDVLTGTRNRSDLELRLQQAIEEAKDSHQLVAVLFLDLDRMKLINDTFGHPVGDLVLREVAARLSTHLNSHHDLTRFGGDEFIVSLRGVTDPAAAAQLAQRLVEDVARPFQVGGETLSLTASVGIALAPLDVTLASRAIEQADQAMYEAKQEGKNTWRFANPALNVLHVPRAQLEVQLRGALERGEFSVHYQPLVSLRYGTVDGFEALLRWTSPTLGQVSPALFIPVAEAREMMSGIGRWVLHTAIHEAGVWRASALPGASVSVNVSATQFSSPDFVTDVREALMEHVLPPSALTLELTESAVLTDPPEARIKLLELKALGVRIALDDFGMGQSSLGQLRSLPIDVLKIDRVFVQDIHEDAAFVRAITSLGHSLGLSVVAEGIEEGATATHLRAVGCDVGQGFFYARPLPASELLTATQALQLRLREGALFLE